MRPLLFQIGSLQFHPYPAMMALAFLVCTLLSARVGRNLKVPVFVPPQGAVWALLGGLFGARVFHTIQFFELKDLWTAFILWQGGLVFYGGLIGGTISTLIYLKVTGYFSKGLADVIAPHVALAEAIVRIGCFMNGCCWGHPTDMPWGVRFPKFSLAYQQQVKDHLIEKGSDLPLAVHPTELYMTVGLVISYFILRWFLNRNPFTFATACGYFFLYGIVRFTVESFRGDSARSVLGLTVSQTISLSFVIGAAVVYAILERRANRKKVEPSTEQTVSPDTA